MTIIAYKNGVMAADTAGYSGSLKMIGAFLKIVRSPDGALAAGCGDCDDCYVFNVWFENGMSSVEPAFKSEADAEPGFIMVKADGSAWRKNGNNPWYPVVPPYTMGHKDACLFADGAMAAGASAAEAVRLTTEFVVYTGGPVQVERIGNFGALTKAVA